MDGRLGHQVVQHAARIGGVVYFATDLEEVFALMRSALLSAGFTPDRAVPTRTRPVTRFEEKYASAGTHQASWRAPLVRTI